VVKVPDLIYIIIPVLTDNVSLSLSFVDIYFLLLCFRFKPLISAFSFHLTLLKFLSEVLTVIM